MGNYHIDVCMGSVRHNMYWGHNNNSPYMTYLRSIGDYAADRSQNNPGREIEICVPYDVFSLLCFYQSEMLLVLLGHQSIILFITNTPHRQSVISLSHGESSLWCLPCECSYNMSIIMRSTIERFAQILVVIWSLTALESAGNIRCVRMIFHRIVKEHFEFTSLSANILPFEQYSM